jgi:DNA-binding GntR family transcriptional regulator
VYCITVSRAVRVLAGEGLLTVVPGWGTFVTER